MKTINIKDDTHKKLKKLAEKEGFSMSSFLDDAVNYFSKTKVNPKTDVLSIKEEIIKLEKRTNKVIAFIVEFEKTNLIPAVQEIKKTSIQVNEVSETLPSIEDLQKISNAITQIDESISRVTQNQKALNTNVEKFLQDFEKNLLGKTFEQTKDVFKFLNLGIGTGKQKAEILAKYDLK